MVLVLPSIAVLQPSEHNNAAAASLPPAGRQPPHTFTCERNVDRVLCMFACVSKYSHNILQYWRQYIMLSPTQATCIVDLSCLNLKHTDEITR